MKIENGNVVFESTGRRARTFGDAFTPNDRDSILYGSDGDISNLSPEEIAEVADYMIDVWKRWASGRYPLGDDDDLQGG